MTANITDREYYALAMLLLDVKLDLEGEQEDDDD